MNDTARFEVPAESWPRLFWRFLRFGLLAWGGPVAQIALIKRELVEEEKWIDPVHFNRVLGMYQVLPGPEAHELCVYFGMRSRGRLGGLLAGLGFMLPGLVLMLLVSWIYVSFGIEAPGFQATLIGVQAAVGALIVRAIHRIGTHAIVDSGRLAIALGAFVSQLCGVHFGVALLAAGLAQLAFNERKHLLAGAVLGALVLASAAWMVLSPGLVSPAVAEAAVVAQGTASTPQLLWSGLRTGLLTFGGAYTAIPFLQRDAVVTGGWMTNAQFLDGIALSGVLPAPLIIFSTFVGYIGGGLSGALAMTVGVFAPAFAFSLVAHDPLERLLGRPRVREVLDGVTAGVVGLISATTLGLLRTGLTDWLTVSVFSVALFVFFRGKGKWTIPSVLLVAAAIGYGRAALLGAGP